MFGRRSQPHLMQLFNEYMHQMILLRDSLLPFKNYQEVRVPINSTAARGIRHLERSRSQFLTALFTKSVTQASVVAYAKALLAPRLPQTGGYGFQYEHGSILPGVLSGGETPFHLLEYVPAKLDPSQREILFDYEFPDYYNAPRFDVPAAGAPKQPDQLINFPAKSAPPVVRNVYLALAPPYSDVPVVRQLELRLDLSNDQCTSIDVGQIARGQRYAYQVRAGGISAAELLPSKPASVHSALDLILHPNGGLITSKQGGVHVIPTTESIVALAILGKLYPENVVLLPENGGIRQTENTGKGFEPKFIIWGGMQHGGYKGRF